MTAAAMALGAAAVAQAEGRTGDAGSGPAWNSLSASQREALAPLAKDWDALDANRKQKWLEISGRYPSMSPAKRERLQQRMGDWARMTPEQRTQARANFQQSKGLSAAERQAQWQAYQSLSPQERQALAERAGPTDKQARRAERLRDAPLEAQAPKTNVVSSDAPPASGGRLVAPTVVQGGPGATTSLITKPAAPPAHQQPGLPKISAGQDMVDRSTLLPKRGPQGAGTQSVPDKQPGQKKPPRD